jgi:hypothetical protein
MSESAHITKPNHWFRAYVPGLYLILLFLWIPWLCLQPFLYFLFDRPVSTEFPIAHVVRGVVCEAVALFLILLFLPFFC